MGALEYTHNVPPAAPGLTVTPLLIADRFAGSMDALVSAGLAVRSEFPGQPGRHATTVRLRPAQREPGGLWPLSCGYRTIRARRQGFVLDRVVDRDTREARSAERMAAQRPSWLPSPETDPAAAALHGTRFLAAVSGDEAASLVLKLEQMLARLSPAARARAARPLSALGAAASGPVVADLLRAAFTVDGLQVQPPLPRAQLVAAQHDPAHAPPYPAQRPDRTRSSFASGGFHHGH